MLKQFVTTAALLAVSATAALAHVTLETREAPMGSTYKAVLRVPHGCEGQPTNVVRVRIPEGFFAVKPMPKAGWTLEKIVGAYENTYVNHGTEVSEGVKEVVWSGGNLLDDEYDEFVVRGSLADSLTAGSTLYFAVVQECPEGLAERWIETPAEGQSTGDLEMPAPSLKLLEKTGGH
ncbi:YcnI family protein [Mesorhizobium sp. CAU 1741]|uniref:YcnI family copper-binding membrane protein n=1 Tax=Mesorhizobium sp. CAU 1741 TaxID=3140366 RepID=UPI00325BF60C